NRDRKRRVGEKSDGSSVRARPATVPGASLASRSPTNAAVIPRPAQRLKPHLTGGRGGAGRARAGHWWFDVDHSGGAGRRLAGPPAQRAGAGGGSPSRPPRRAGGANEKTNAPPPRAPTRR